MNPRVRVNPRTLFDAAQWARLSAPSRWRGPWLVAHAWGVILATGALAVVWPVTIPLAIMVIGARQLGLAILMHDAAHGALHPDPRVNRWLGLHLTLGDMRAYRPYHLSHHAHVQQADDPDLVLSAPFPITRASFRRKIVRDLTGQTYVKQQWAMPLRTIARARGQRLRAIAALVRHRRGFFAGAVVTIALTAPLGAWWAWFVLWLVPQATWLPLVTRLRNIAEHALVAQGEPDPWRQARTTRANLLERALIAPYWVNYHSEHHMFWYVPCYRLAQLHRALVRQGMGERMLTAPGYRAVLRAATAKGLTR